MNQSPALRSMRENPSSEGLSQSGRPLVEVGTVFHLCWELLAIGDPPEIPAGATIYNLDPQTFSSKDSKQQKIESMLKKDKKNI